MADLAQRLERNREMERQLNVELAAPDLSEADRITLELAGLAISEDRRMLLTLIETEGARH